MVKERNRIELTFYKTVNNYKQPRLVILSEAYEYSVEKVSKTTIYSLITSPCTEVFSLCNCESRKEIVLS